MLVSFAVPSGRAHELAEEMTEATERFLAALSPEQKQKASFELKDDERQNWHFTPVPRKGLPLKEMSGDQRALALGLLNTGLSQRGFLKATSVMSLEAILKEIEQGKGPVRDPELYFVSIFGKPEAHGAWGWRFEGHHLAINFTLAGGEVTITPSFLGSNPGEVRQGPRQGLRVLGAEEDLGRKLAQSLNESQAKIAIFTNVAPSEMITAEKRKAWVLEPLGISMKALSSGQQALLWDIIREYIHRARGEVADREFAALKAASPESITFAWAGSLEKGLGHYYRVQAPNFLLEYDNTQNNANHVHAVWRDLKNDFGEDILRKHYDEAHRKQ